MLKAKKTRQSFYSLLDYFINYQLFRADPETEKHIRSIIGSQIDVIKNELRNLYITKARNIFPNLNSPEEYEKINIKIANVHDYVSVRMVLDQLANFKIPRDSNLWFEDPFVIQYRIDKEEVLLATNNSGGAMGCLLFKNHIEGIDIDTIIIDKNYRRRGIGRKLIDYCLSIVRKRNSKKSKITTGSYKCFRDKGFYLKMGFKLKNNCKNQDWWEFEKEIL